MKHQTFLSKILGNILPIIILSILCNGAFSATKIIIEPQSGRTPILNAIKQAKKSIKMEMYLLSDQKIIHALINSAKQGVNIQVLLEQTPYQSNNKPNTQPERVFSQLSKAGIHVKWTSPHYKLTHEKALIIDHKTAYILTFNQTYSAYKFNREYGIIDTDANDVSEIEKVFNNDWSNKNPKVFEKNLLWSPINARSKILGLIYAAKFSLFIEAEEVQDWAIEAALVKRAKSGIDVRLILPKSTQIPKNVKNLMKHGVKIRFLNQNKKQLYMHAKMILADGQSAYIGSENLSYASLNYNRELGIILRQSRGYQEKHILKILEKTFLLDWSHAVHRTA